MRVMDIALTYKCNLHCEHCSAAVFDARGKTNLTIHDVRTLAEAALEMDFLSVNLTGGEPLLRPDILQIASLFNRRRLYLSVQSNLLLLTESMALQLKDHGVCCFTTSLDSHDPAEHNGFRKHENAYSQTLRGIEVARKAGLAVLVGGTITHQNIRSEGLKTLIRQVNDAGAIFLYNLAVPCGAWAGNTEVCLTPEDRDYLNHLLQEFPLSTTDHEPGRNAKGCPAGMEKIYITAFGDVIPCPFIHVSFGNIRKEPLADIVARMRRSSFFSQYQPVCIAAEDKTLHRDIFDVLPGHRLPIDCNAVPRLRRELADTSAQADAEKKTPRTIPTEPATCVVCGSAEHTIAARGQDFIYRTSPDSFTMVRCSQCGHIYLSPRPQLSSASRIYPQDYYTLAGDHTNNRIVAFFKEKVVISRLNFFDFSRPGAAILECGCGDCALLLALKRVYPHLDCAGVDLTFSPEVREAGRRAGIRLIEGPMEQVPLPEAAFDLIIMNQFIEHLWDPDSVMRAAAQSLKPGGFLSVSTVNTEGYDRAHFASKAWGGYYFPRHLNLFSHDQLRSYLESFDLETVRWRSLLAPIIWLHSLEAYFGPQSGRKHILGRDFFSPSNPVLLALFTVVDGVARLFGRITSNQIVCLRKSTSRGRSL